MFAGDILRGVALSLNCPLAHESSFRSFSSPETSTPLGPAGFCGQPLLVAHARQWTPKQPAARRLRSELRGLGTTLVLLTPVRIFCLEPVRAFGEPDGTEPQIDREAFQALFQPAQRCGTSPLSDSRSEHGVLHIALLNPSAQLVWSHSVEAELPPAEALIEALSGARRRLQQSSGRTFAVTRAELVASLVGAFSMTFGDACRPSSPLSTPIPPSTIPASIAPAESEFRARSGGRKPPALS